MVGEIIGAIIIGFLAGLLARALLPGKQHMGLLLTTLLGIAGAFVGYLIFAELLGIGDDDKFDLGGLPGAIIGAMLLLFVYDRFIARDPAPAGGRAAAPAVEGEDRNDRRIERDRARAARPR